METLWFPGADNIDEFWRLLCNAENHIQEIPKERWNISSYYSKDKNEHGKTYAKHAGLLNDVYGFDHKLFGINAMEAERMDPQHRLALEVSYRALEDAGFTLKEIQDSDTCVFMGVMNTDYGNLASTDPGFADTYAAVGAAASMLSNRLSYFYNIHGPSVTIDTACSSGLIAVHLGMQTITSGQSTMAICGGANVILSPTTFVSLSKARMASTAGQCQAFSDSADGYVRSEGCGVVILKDLTQAMKDGDKIWSIITTASNSDGRASSPITSPSANLQASLIEQALRQASLSADHIQYVEMHGTGTPVGDPVETSAVGRIIGRNKTTGPCLVGSVKTNIGHTEAAAGLAGLIKVLLMMRNETFAPSVLFGEIKTSLNLTEKNLEVVKDCKEWPPLVIDDKQIRIAAVNSFGFGGSNCHLIAQSGNVKKQQIQNDKNGSYSQIVLFTGISEEATNKSIAEFIAADVLRTETLSQIANTSLFSRTHFSHRYALVVTTKAELNDKLQSTLSKNSSFGRKINDPKNLNIIFVFCGMGTHWVNMGQRLYETEEVYRNTIDQLEQIFQGFGDIKLKDVIQGLCPLDDPKFGQPAIFACQVALCDLWKSKGVHPDCIVGHSVGEVAAAYAAGRLTLETAGFIVSHRGGILSRAKEGAMLVIGHIPVEIIASHVTSHNLEIAAINSPNSCTVAGASEDIENFKISLEDQNPKAFVRRLAVNVAYHSSQMECLLEPLKQSLHGRLHERNINKGSQVKIISTVTGKLGTDEDFISSEYWLRNVRNCVQFNDAMKQAFVAEANNIVIEIGPRAALKANIKEIAGTIKYEMFPSILQNNDESFYITLAKCYELDAVHVGRNRKRSVASHPRYGMVKKPLYLEPETATALRHTGVQDTSKLRHPFLIQNLNSTENEFQCKLNEKNTPFVFEHFIKESIIVPGATYVELGIAATMNVICIEGSDLSNKNCISRVSFNQAKFVHNNKKNCTLDVKVTRLSNEKFAFSVTSNEALHASGECSLSNKKRSYRVNVKDLNANHLHSFTKTDVYSKLQSHNFRYGPLLQCIVSGTVGKRECLVTIQLPCNIELDQTHFHPILLDNILQAGIMIPYQQSLSMKGQIVPYGIHEISIFHRLEQNVIIYLKAVEMSRYSIELDVNVMNSVGLVLATLKGVKYGVADKEHNFWVEENMFEFAWRKLELTQNPSTIKDVVILCDNNDDIRDDWLTSNVRIIRLTNEEINGIWNDENIFVDIFKSVDILGTSLVFALGLHQKHKQVNNMTGLEVQDSVLYASFTFVQLTKYLYHKGKGVALYLLTRGVNALLKQKKCTTSARFNTVVGAATLGCARSINKENPMFRLQAIDLSSFTEEDIKVMLQFVNTPNNTFEVVIDNATIEFGALSPSPIELPLHKTISVESRKDVSLQLCSTEDKIAFFKKSDQRTYGNLMDVLCIRLKKEELIQSQEHVLTHSKDADIEAYDAIVENADGKRFHYVGRHKSCSKVSTKESLLIPYENFPSSLPYLSYWLIAWQCMKKLNKRKRYKVNLSGVGEVWSYVVKYLATMLGIVIDESARDVQTIAIVYSFKAIQLANQKYNFVICLNDTTDLVAVDCTSVVYANHILSVGKLDKYVAKFKAWLKSLDKVAIQQNLANFEIDYTAKCDLQRVSNNIGKKLEPQCSSEDVFIEYDKCERLPVLAQSPKELMRKDGVYLIIGGSKGLGYETVKELARLGAKYICIVSRSGISQEKRKELKVVEKQCQCQIFELRADVSNIKALSDGLYAINKAYNKPVRGVFHSAAVTCDAIIPSMTLAKFRKALEPKVLGLWNIYMLTKDMELDIFMMYSSIASLFGNAGQTNYSAGNAFKDAVACLRRIDTSVGQSVCWGALDLGILQDNLNAKKKLQSLGMSVLALDEILKCFRHALLYDVAVLSYTRFDWPKWHEWMCKAPALLHEQYSAIIEQKCHYLKIHEGVSFRNLAYKSRSSDEYVLNVVKAVACLKDEDINFKMTLLNLGADSQDRQKIHAILMEDVGLTDKDLNVMDMTEMTLQNLIDKVRSMRRISKSEANPQDLANTPRVSCDDVTLSVDEDRIDAEDSPEESVRKLSICFPPIDDSLRDINGDVLLSATQMEITTFGVSEFGHCTKDGVTMDLSENMDEGNVQDEVDMDWNSILRNTAHVVVIPVFCTVMYALMYSLGKKLTSD